MKQEGARTEMLIGRAGMHKLEKATVAVFGLGGVGSFAAEALARAGVGSLVLVDSDIVSVTNINRQLCALHSTIGLQKVDVMKRRILDINPAAKVQALPLFYAGDTVHGVELAGLDYIIDAIDTVSSKLVLIENADRAGVRIISSMGTGNKMYPARLEVGDINETSVCPLARVMRRELRDMGVERLKVVYSKEKPMQALSPNEENVPGSFSFVPPVAGMILAGEVVRDILGYI